MPPDPPSTRCGCAASAYALPRLTTTHHILGRTLHYFLGRTLNSPLPGADFESKPRGKPLVIPLPHAGAIWSVLSVLNNLRNPPTPGAPVCLKSRPKPVVTPRPSRGGGVRALHWLVHKDEWILCKEFYISLYTDSRHLRHAEAAGNERGQLVTPPGDRAVARSLND